MYRLRDWQLVCVAECEASKSLRWWPVAAASSVDVVHLHGRTTPRVHQNEISAVWMYGAGTQTKSLGILSCKHCVYTRTAKIVSASYAGPNTVSYLSVGQFTGGGTSACHGRQNPSRCRRPSSAGLMQRRRPVRALAGPGRCRWLAVRETGPHLRDRPATCERARCALDARR